MTPRELSIDWSVYDSFPPDIVWCRCGGRWFTHTALVGYRNDTGTTNPRLFARRPCPDCGRTDHLCRVRAGRWLSPLSFAGTS